VVSKRWAEKRYDKKLKIIMALLNYDFLPSPLRPSFIHYYDNTA
jgi:hypothetical protein